MEQRPPHPIAAALLSDGPARDDQQELLLFGRFIGSWDLDVCWFDGGRVVRRERGEWHFGWILGGRAIQDVWIVPPRSDNVPDTDVYECGTSIRFYDPRLNAWRSTWHGPVQGSVRPFTANLQGTEIVLEGQELGGASIRWIFSDIESDRFAWRFETKLERSHSWATVQSFDCVRRA